jgi:hypothetical protein
VKRNPAGDGGSFSAQAYDFDQQMVNIAGAGKNLRNFRENI